MKEKLRAILIDDEPLCTAGLAIDVESVCPEIEVICTENNPKKAVQLIQEHKPDLIFLDIEMPGMNGFQLLDEVRDIAFQVIFVTAYDDFAVQAFREHAIDYIMKPVDRTQLKEATDKALQSREDSDQIDKVISLLQSMHLGPKSKKLSVPNSDGYDLIPIADIHYCRSQGNYTEIHFNGESKLISKALKHIESALEGNNFHRVHASYLVNMDKVKSVHRNDGGYLIMENDFRINMSRNKKGDVFDKLK